MRGCELGALGRVDNYFNLFFIFLTPPPLPEVQLVWFHVCPLTP